MIIANNQETLVKSLQGKSTRLALGNFDGVHLGHRQLIRGLVRQCSSNGETSVVMTFSPHPAQFFGRNQEFRKIDTPLIQQGILANLGVDVLLELNFNSALAGMSGQEFVDTFLTPLGVREVFVGADFRFGKDRSSGLDALKRIGDQAGFAVSVVKTFENDGLVVSSSRLRHLITNEGEMELVAKLLERPYGLEGVVSEGNKLGRSLGFPTANLEGVVQVIPKLGVYGGTLSVLDLVDAGSSFLTDLPCVINVGVRPTVSNLPNVTIEAHVYGPAGEHLHLYGRKVLLKFLARIRDEKRFDGLEDLKNQILKDIATAQKLAQS